MALYKNYMLFLLSLLLVLSGMYVFFQKPFRAASRRSVS